MVPLPMLQIHFKRGKVKYSIFAIVANFCSIADEMKHIQSLQLHWKVQSFACNATESKIIETKNVNVTVLECQIEVFNIFLSLKFQWFDLQFHFLDIVSD